VTGLEGGVRTENSFERSMSSGRMEEVVALVGDFLSLCLVKTSSFEDLTLMGGFVCRGFLVSCFVSGFNPCISFSVEALVIWG